MLFGGVVVQAAFADDSDTVGDSTTIHETAPDDVDEPDAVEIPADQVDNEPTFPSNPPGGVVHPGGQYCDPSNVYTPTAKGGYHMRGVGYQQANTNATSRSMTSTFTSTATGTVGVAVSGTLTTSVNIMIAKIETKYEISLSSSMSVGFSNSSSIVTPAHYTTYAQYGVYRLHNLGVSYHYYSNCATSTHVTVSSYTPHHVGWYISESKTS
jgi:hypothetical protein